MPAKFLRLGDEALHVLHTGPTTLPEVPPCLEQGIPFLFLAGEGGSAAMWRGFLEAFGREHCAVAVDLPAHGRSSGIDGPGSVADAVEVLGTLLDRLDAPPLVVVGHGYGGHLALATALARPERVRAVVTIGTALSGRFPEEHATKLRDVVRGRLGQQFDTPYFGPKPDMAVIRSFWTELTKTDPKVRLTDIDAYAQSDLTEALAALDRPVLALHGEHDRICPAAAAQEMARATSRARVELVPDAGHVAHLESTARVRRAIEAFLG